MKDIHDSAANASEAHGQTDNGYVDYMAGANMVGFERVGDTLVVFDIVN